MDIESTGKLFLLLGLGLLVLGGLFLLFSRIPVLQNFGKLPGDIRIEGGNFACFFPIVSMCLLSLILTIAVNVVARLLR